MSNPSKMRGTQWESALVAYLIAQGWPHCERRALNGSLDRGDIAGVAGVMIEAKNCKAITIPAWIDEAQAQKANSGAAVGIVWWKRRGKTDPGQGFVSMTGAQFVELLRLAGFAP